MNFESLDNCAIIQSDQFLFEGSEQQTLGEDFATHVLNQLKNRLNCDVSEVVGGECGWHFTVRFFDKTYCFFLHWIFDSNREDAWAIQIELWRIPIIGFLFRRNDAALANFLELVRPILDSDKCFTSVKWYTQSDFNSMY